MKFGTKTIQKLKNKKSSIEELNEKYFYTKKDGINIENILKLLNENICSFKEIVHKFKNDLTLGILIQNEKLFKKLIESTLLNIDDLKYLLNRINNNYELLRSTENTSLLNYIVENELFQELVDKFKSIKDKDFDPCLYELLKNKRLFEKLIQNNILDKEDMRYLLSQIDKGFELEYLSENTILLKHILNEFVLDKKLVDRVDEILENYTENWYIRCINRNDIHNIFDFIEDWNKNNEEVLKLIELNKKIYLLNSFDLNENQQLEVIELLKDNEIARNRLNQIIDNHLESNYNFESLISCLKKPEKKTLLNI